MSEKKEIKERIIYVIEDGHYCAYSLNMPFLIIQAISEEDMKDKMRELASSFLKHLQHTIDNNLFEYVDGKAPITP
jgi:hypothetical protein